LEEQRPNIKCPQGCTSSRVLGRVLLSSPASGASFGLWHGHSSLCLYSLCLQSSVLLHSSRWISSWDLY
jgi:hypothetical protein